MTKEQRYEISVLASDLSEKLNSLENHKNLNTPTDPVLKEAAFIAFHIVETECFEAWQKLQQAKLRIAGVK